MIDHWHHPNTSCTSRKPGVEVVRYVGSFSKKVPPSHSSWYWLEENRSSSTKSCHPAIGSPTKRSRRKYWRGMEGFEGSWSHDFFVKEVSVVCSAKKRGVRIYVNTQQTFYLKAMTAAFPLVENCVQSATAGLTCQCLPSITFMVTIFHFNHQESDVRRGGGGPQNRGMGVRFFWGSHPWFQFPLTHPLQEYYWVVQYSNTLMVREWPLRLRAAFRAWLYIYVHWWLR